MSVSKVCWRKTKHGLWTCSLGQRGCRVRIFEKRLNGQYYREVWRSGSGRSTRCLGTANRREAERLGRELLKALLTGAAAIGQGPLRLGNLVRMYLTESPSHLDNTSSSQADARARSQTLLGFFGSECDVSRLEAKDQAAFSAARLAGGIRRPDGSVTRPVRARSVEADLVVLHQMLAWATTTRRPNGDRLLDQHPLHGVKRVSEKNPKRPVATWERFVTTREAIQQFRSEAGTAEEIDRWLKLEAALVLAEATGRRLSSIRQLRWEDIDWSQGTIRWRAEADKKRKEWVVPYPPELLGFLRQVRLQQGAVGGWIFRGQRHPDQPMDRHLFDKWLGVAERRAGLPKLDGGIWHPYRRAWASARKHLPLKDVAAAGGWSDTETLLKCYQEADQETMLRVTSEPQKVRSGASSG